MILSEMLEIYEKQYSSTAPLYASHLNKIKASGTRADGSIDLFKLIYNAQVFGYMSRVCQEAEQGAQITPGELHTV